MNAIFAAIEKLFPDLVKNKKLGLAWAMFVVAVPWLIYFVLTYPAEKAKFDHFSVEMDAVRTDTDSALAFYDVVSPQIVDAIQVRIYFLQNFSGKYPYDTVKPEVIAQGYKQVEDVLSGIASARGVINGMNFSMQELNGYQEGFSQDLTLMETYLKGYENFYLALIRGDAKEALNISANFESSKAIESVNGFQSRLGNFTEVAKSAMNKRMVDIEEKTNEIALFKIKEFIAWVTLIYIIVFIPSAIIYYRRAKLRAKSKREKQRNKLKNKVQSRPPKAG